MRSQKLKARLSVLIALSAGLVGARGGPLDRLAAEGIVASNLLRASDIVLGRVANIRELRRDVVHRGSPISVRVLGASVTVVQVLKGQQATELEVEGWLEPADFANDFGWQRLDAGKAYVLFLVKGPQGGRFAPVSPVRFAVETEAIPQGPLGDCSEALRHIGWMNVNASSPPIAEAWAWFLRGVWDPERDLGFWMTQMKESRLTIRGIALLTLAENAPQTPGLYSNVLAYLDAAAVSDQGRLRSQLAALLPKLVPQQLPLSEEIRKWLRSSAWEVKEAALHLAGQRKDAALAPDIVRLMKASDDRLVQYECIKALWGIKGGRLISYPVFLKQPERYLAEWEQVAGPQ